MGLNFTLQMIMDGLGEVVVEQFGLDPAAAVIYSAARLQKDLDYFEPDILYIGQLSDLPENPPQEGSFCWLCISNQLVPPRYRLITQACLVTVAGNQQDANSQDPVNLLGRIKRWIDERRVLQQGADRLFAALVSNRGLQYIMDVAADVLDNPVKISDRSFKTFASSKNVITDDHYWQVVTQLGSAPPDPIQSEVFRAHIQQVYLTGEPIISSVAGVTHAIMANRITIGDRIIGHLAVLNNNRPFSSGDAEIVKLLCQVISTELQKDSFFHSLKGRKFEFFITELLNGQVTSAELALERAKYLDLDLQGNLYVLIARHAKVTEETPSLVYIRSLIESLINENRSVIHNNAIVFLISRDTKTAPQFGIADDEMISVLQANHLVAGLSQRFEHVTDISKYYQQASKAIEIGLRLNPEPSRCLFAYDHYVIYDLVDRVAAQHDPRSFINPLVYDLIDYDKRNNTVLAHSLAEYLTRRDNPKEAANALGIHRNTLDYRIKKIEKILNIHLSDPVISWSLFLSFKILELLEVNLPQAQR